MESTTTTEALSKDKEYTRRQRRLLRPQRRRMRFRCGIGPWGPPICPRRSMACACCLGSVQFPLRPLSQTIRSSRKRCPQRFCSGQKRWFHCTLSGVCWWRWRGNARWVPCSCACTLCSPFGWTAMSRRWRFGDSGAVIVVRWRVSLICWWIWVAVGRITGVVLPHVVWDYQEEPVEVTVVGDMWLGTGDHMPEDAEEFTLCRFSDDSLDGFREAGHHGFLTCRLVYIECHGVSMFRWWGWCPWWRII